MQQPKSAEQVLETLICSIKVSLSELTLGRVWEDEFVCGEMYAYLECLEIIQQWSEAENFGLAGNLEEKYRLI